MTSETNGVSSSTHTNNSNNNKNSWKQLQVWQQAWCQATPAAPPDDDNPITATREWIQQRHADSFDKKTLDRLLKWLLTLPLPNEKELILRHIEWQVVVLLELRVTLALTLFLERFSHCHAQTAKKVQRQQEQSLPRKRRRAGEKETSPERQLYEFLIQQLTRAVFCLPANQPLAMFVTQHCLTRTIWEKLPLLVTEILDFFEIENPYLASKSDKEEEDFVRPKTKRNKPMPLPSTATVPPRRPLLAASKINRNRGHLNHFHGMLNDVTKLLDDSKPIMTAGSSKKRSVITPLTTSTTNQRTTNKDMKARTHSMIASSQKPIDVINNPLPEPRFHVSDSIPFSSSISRPKAHVVVAETPNMPWTESRFAAETPVGIDHDNPIYRNCLPDCIDDEYPSDPLVPENSNIKPIKLFAALSKKPHHSLPSESNSLSIVPAVNDEQTRPKKRTTSSAVEAARSFLRRKSL